MAGRTLYFVIPGDAETRTGGYGYDREIVAGLRRREWTVWLVPLAGAYPWPTAEERTAAANALAAVPDAACVVVDGLALGVLPDELAQQQSRLRLIALVHHPLGFETGLDQATSRVLLDSERRALSSARGVVVTSHRTATDVQQLGVPSRLIAVVEPGTAPAPLAEGSAGAALRLLCVASLVPRKGHHTLFDALERLTHLQWHLTCVGGPDRDPSFASALAARAGHGPLAGRVDLAGELAGRALEAAYAASDLFVLPTHYEGYGMAVAEALARGIPVVSTATGAIAELVGDRAGVLVPPSDPEALARVLERLLLERSMRDDLRRGARDARASLATWDDASARMEEALTRFCGR